MKLLSCGFSILIFAVINVDCSYSDWEKSDKNPWRGITMLCSTEDPTNVSISCHGVRIVKRVIQQLLERVSDKQNIEIVDGVSLVDNIDGKTRRARTLSNPIFGFLEDRELRVKLSALLPSNFGHYSKNNYTEVSARGSNGFGFGGGKKNGNNFLFLALMMGKMLGVMGFGALGLISMKALMASSLALMLSLIVAAKKYTSGSSTSSSNDGYHVVYAHEPHHERRSTDDIELSPYRGWINNRSGMKSVSRR